MVSRRSSRSASWSSSERSESPANPGGSHASTLQRLTVGGLPVVVSDATTIRRGDAIIAVSDL